MGSERAAPDGRGAALIRVTDTGGVTAEQWSALFSIVAGLALAAASYVQWWDMTYEGHLRTRPWVKFTLLPGAITLFLAALGFLLFSVFSE